MSREKRKRPPRLKPRMSSSAKAKLFLGLLFGLFMLYVFIGGEYGFYRRWSLKQSAQGLREDIASLEAENARLQEEKALLTDDLDYIEKMARERYGMKRVGETVYYIEFDSTEGRRAGDTKKKP